MVKLTVVVSDLHGVSSRQIMHALIGGCQDPEGVAHQAHGTLRRKISALEEALDRQTPSPTIMRSCWR